MDDMALWADDRPALRTALIAGERFLADELGLMLKPTPYLNRTAHGMDFLGFRVHRDRLELNRNSKVRFRRRLNRLETEYAAGGIGEAELQRRATALTAFTVAAGASSWHFRRSAIDSIRRAVEGPFPCEPGRQLEQQRQELPCGEPQQERAGQPEQQPGLSLGPSPAGGADA